MKGLFGLWSHLILVIEGYNMDHPLQILFPEIVIQLFQHEEKI
jgi:hypothetical protein